ncbi:hypothetical protein ACFOKI_11775 [Sphingomonas qilianensis]|uniref:Secreted protein n=1 Tax=Sphingomonas qilianensis TaxID=1736690 RepID=A0ABU9XT78_9SPHN
MDTAGAVLFALAVGDAVAAVAAWTTTTGADAAFLSEVDDELVAAAAAMAATGTPNANSNSDFLNCDFVKTSIPLPRVIGAWSAA